MYMCVEEKSLAKRECVALCFRVIYWNKIFLNVLLVDFAPFKTIFFFIPDGMFKKSKKSITQIV